MDIHARRRQVRIGVALIAEVLADVLEDVDEGISATEVRDRTGCSTDDLEYNVCLGTLSHMRKRGDAVNDHHGTNIPSGSWHLA